VIEWGRYFVGRQRERSQQRLEFSTWRQPSSRRPTPLLALLVVAAVTLVISPMTATAQSPPPSKDIVFTGGFDTGNLSQWAFGAQCANTGVASNESAARGTVNLTVRIVGQGKYSARFNLPASDVNNACEVLDERLIGLGGDDYYGLMAFFPKTWREPSPAGWGLSIAQLGFQGIWGSPISLNAHTNNIALEMQTGLCSPVSSAHPGCAYVKSLAAVPPPLARGVWHELIVHVHRTTDSTGVVEAWHRLKGQKRWKQTVSLRGYPTVQWTPDRLSVLNFNATVDKIGAYRGHASFPLSVWLDGFVRATSFAAAAATLP
jgi:hypothetical protein